MDLRRDLRKEIKKATEMYIESVTQESPDNAPTETIQTVSEGMINIVESEEVSRPSQFVKSDPFEYKVGVFEPIAEKIVDKLGTKPVPEVDIDEDGVVATEAPDVKREFERALMEFAGLVMDYAGEFEFSEEAFSAAYEENFYPRFTDRKQAKIIIPMSQVVTDEAVILSDNFELESDYFGPYTICNIQISPISELEQNGIATFDEELRTTVTPRLATSYEASQKLQFEIFRRRSYREISGRNSENLDPKQITVTPLERLSSHIYRELIQEMVETTKQVIRLDSPMCNPGFQSAYVSVSGFLEYRDIAINIINKYPIDDEGNRGTVSFTRNKSAKFESFWDRYVDLVSAAEDEFSRPLTRFDEMFRKRREEDQLLDCLIALEKTLLTDTSKASSYTFRMGLRAGILLADSERDPNWDRDKVYEFFRELYKIRGDIVHNDMSVQNALNQEDDSVLSEYDAPSQFLDQTRVLLANIILRYMDQRIEHNISIHGTNTDIDKAARHSDYNPS